MVAFAGLTGCRLHAHSPQRGGPAGSDLAAAAKEEAAHHGPASLPDLRGRRAPRRTPREEAAAEERALERVVAHHPAAAEAVDLAGGVEPLERGAVAAQAASLQVGLQTAQRLAGQDVEAYG